MKKKMTHHYVLNFLIATTLCSQHISGFSPTYSGRINKIRARNTKLFVGSSFDPDDQQHNNLQIINEDENQEDEPSVQIINEDENQEDAPSAINNPSPLLSMLTGGGPPIQVDDTNLLYYDVFLLVNLSASISFWVAHRMQYTYIPMALNEGALLSISWIIAGLANGAFLYSAIDGHYDPLGRGTDEGKGGPKSAGLLGLSTFISASSIRIVIALACAVYQHRPVGADGEELIPLEIVTGLALMSLWRASHSANTPRV